MKFSIITIVTSLFFTTIYPAFALDLEGVELDRTPALSLEEAARQSTYVFIGRVIRLQTGDIAVLELDKKIIGDVPDEIKINRAYDAYDVEGRLESLIYPYFIGKRYVVFASRNEEGIFLPYYTKNVQWTIAKIENDMVNIVKFRDRDVTEMKISDFSKAVKKAVK